MSETIRARYIGPYGRGHHRARVDGVGEVFYSQVMELTELQLSKLPPAEWVEVADLCQHSNMHGNFCEKLGVKGQTFCEFHQKEFAVRAQLTGDKTDGISPST